METPKIIDLEIVTNNFIKLLKNSKIPYMVVGGLAVNYFGDFRLTKDIDVVIAIDLSKIEKILNLLGRGKYKFHKEEINALAKLSNHFTITDPSDTYRIDFWIPKTYYEKKAFARRKKKRTKTGLVSFITPEDLVLFKLIANRTQDILDVESILQRQKGKLDRKYLRFWAIALNIYEKLKKLEAKL